MASLRTTIDKLLDELGTRIIYRNIDSGGKAYVQLNLIVVNPNLPGKATHLASATTGDGTGSSAGGDAP